MNSTVQNCNIHLSTLHPYIDQITGEHQHGFKHNRSTSGQIFAVIRLEKKWDYNETAHQLFTEFKKSYDSVRRKLLYSILIEFGILKKLERFIKIFLNETCSNVHRGKQLFNVSYSEWSKSRRCFIAITVQYCFRIHNNFKEK
jgi:hypothetical protein